MLRVGLVLLGLVVVRGSMVEELKPDLATAQAVGAGCLTVGCILGIRHLVNAGIFHKVKVSDGKFEGAKYFYKTHTSVYKDCGPHFCAVINLATSVTKTKNIWDLGISCLGIYYDSPEMVDPSKTRYAAGITVPEEMEELKEQLRGEGYKEVDLPSAKSGYAEHPYNGIISILLGVFKVYPALGKWLEAQDYCDPDHLKPAVPFCELNHGNNELTQYYAILENTDAFMLGLEDPIKYMEKHPNPKWKGSKKADAKPTLRQPKSTSG